LKKIITEQHKFKHKLFRREHWKQEIQQRQQCELNLQQFDVESGFC